MSSDPTITGDTSSNPGEVASADPTPTNPTPANVAPAPQDSYTKLAMRNMVRKGKRSLVEFGLTSVGLLALLIGLSYLTR